MLHRPTPLQCPDARPVDASVHPEDAAKALVDGQTLRVTDSYSTAADILDALGELLRPPREDAPHPVRRRFMQQSRETAKRLVVPILDQQLALNGATDIGFLKELYAGEDRFLLPFVEVQELHGAWDTYTLGVKLAVLGHEVHPFYGTYAPTRSTHLELFATWLSGYQGPRTRAVDVGTGCGVLAMMMAKTFEHVVATDSNPNAVESVRRELRRRPRPIEVVETDLLEGVQDADLIVFNPPWMKGPVQSPLDAALFFTDGLFERFFDQAASRLRPDGRLVLVFSNILRLVQPDVPHPIDQELERDRFTLVNKSQRKVKPSPGRKRTREKVQVWELRLSPPSG
jgi:SAM-dependent methyltransferase